MVIHVYLINGQSNLFNILDRNNMVADYGSHSIWNICIATDNSSGALS